MLGNWGCKKEGVAYITCILLHLFPYGEPTEQITGKLTKMLRAAIAFLEVPASYGTKSGLTNMSLIISLLLMDILKLQLKYLSEIFISLILFQIYSGHSFWDPLYIREYTEGRKTEFHFSANWKENCILVLNYPNIYIYKHIDKENVLKKYVIWRKGDFWQHGSKPSWTLNFPTLSYKSMCSHMYFLE